MTKKKKKRKLKLNYKRIFKILIFILLIVLISLYFLNLRIKNIYILGTNKIKDIEIIETAGIKDYPKIFRLKTSKIKKDLKNNPLIKDVKIKRNIFGAITFNIEERNILFYYNELEKYITSDNVEIEDNNNYLGYPALINHIPDNIREKLVIALNKVDSNILKMINTLEYTPYKDSKGKVIDETRFKLTMNDTNTVMIDTVNIRKLNKYMTIYVSLNMKDVKGLLYLDTITDDNILFESYTSIEQAKKEKEEKEKKEAEGEKTEEEKKEEDKPEEHQENNEANPTE